jgi:hypothetical protein
MKTRILLFCILCFSGVQFVGAQLKSPVRIEIDGLSHDYIHGLLKEINKRTDIQIVGIAEKNKDLARRLVHQYGFERERRL